MNKLAKWKIKLLLIALAPSLLLQGCWDVADIDNRMIAGVIGIAVDSENRTEVWVRFPKPELSVALSGGGSGGSPSFVLVHQKGKTVIDALDKLRFKLPKALQLSSVRTLFVEEELAKKGLEPFIEFAVRDRTIPLNSQIAIVSGSVSSILSKENPSGEAAGLFAKQFFEPFAGGSPKKNGVDLWKLFSRFRNPLQENLVPVIAPANDSSFKLKGNAYFVEDKMVGMITDDDTLIYSLITGKIENAEIETTQGADVRLLNNHTSIKTAWTEQGKPLIRVNTELIFSLIDTSYVKQPDIKKIEASVSELLERRAAKVIEETQKKKSDIFGFGNRYRGSIGPDQYERWPDLFQDAQIKVHVRSRMRNYGLKHLKGDFAS